jgi:hypothetical protein
MTITRLLIAQYERVLVWKNRRFAGILEPGVRWIVTPFVSVAVELYDMTVPEFEHPRVDWLLKEARVEMERHFDIVELSERQVGVVYKNGKLAGVLPAGKRQLYWKGAVDVHVTKLDISTAVEVA